MSNSQSFSLEDFAGKVRLFPLPNLVLFPHVMQPLHIFEPRYRSLLEAALGDDRLIAMAILAPGWESDYEGRPALYPTACLSRVTTYHRLEDGTYNVLVLGLRRIKLLHELAPARDFREATIELCEDFCPPSRRQVEQQLRDRLAHAIRNTDCLPREAWQQLEPSFGDNLSLAALTDVLSFLMNLDVTAKEALLADTDICRRAKRLLKLLDDPSCGGPSSDSDYPPEFSVN